MNLIIALVPDSGIAGLNLQEDWSVGCHDPETTIKYTVYDMSFEV